MARKTRRGNGEGSISRRKDGRWEARYMVETPKGPKRKVLYGKTRAEVAQKLTEAMAARDKGLIFDAENQTLGEYMDRWLNGSVKSSVKPVTFENYERLVRNHIASCLGHIKLKTLTAAHVQGFYQERQDVGLSPASVRYMHAILHRALKQAHKWRLANENVASATDPPKPQPEEIRPLANRLKPCSRRLVVNASKPSTCSPSTVDSGKANCSGSSGRTWTWKRARCKYAGRSPRRRTVLPSLPQRQPRAAEASRSPPGPWKLSSATASGKRRRWSRLAPSIKIRASCSPRKSARL